MIEYTEYLNNKCFKNKEETISQLLDRIKLLSFSWLEANNLCLTFGFHNW